MPIKVGYWKIRGLGAPCRMSCAYAETEYESVEYEAFPKEGGGWDVSSWFDVKPGLVEKNGLMNLPYIEDGEVLVTQSNSCLMYLGRKFGQLGANEADLIAVEQVLCQVMDLRNDTTKHAYGDGDIEAECKSCLNHFKKIETFMTQRGTKFSAADTITVADFHLWEMIDQHKRMANKCGQAEGFLQEFPNMLAIYDAIRAEPKLKGYFEGPQYAIPINNKMAKYGGDADDGR